MAGVLKTCFCLVIGIALIARSYLPLAIEFKQMSDLQQGARLNHWPREFAHFIANGGIKHPGWNASARTIRQSSHEHVRSNFDDLQTIALVKQRMKWVVKFPSAPQAGSVKRVCWSGPKTQFRPNTKF